MAFRLLLKGGVLAITGADPLNRDLTGERALQRGA